MTLLRLLEHRRSCRKFTDQKVEKDKIESIIKGTLTAPSSKNTRSTRLAVIENREIIEKLGQTRAYGSAFISGAPLVIAVMGDAEVSNLWNVNCAISTAILQLMAGDQGLGSCWVHVNDRPHRDEEPEGTTAQEYIHSLVPETKSYNIMCLVALGYPTEDPRPRKEQDDSDKVIFVK